MTEEEPFQISSGSGSDEEDESTPKFKTTFISIDSSSNEIDTVKIKKEKNDDIEVIVIDSSSGSSGAQDSSLRSVNGYSDFSHMKTSTTRVKEETPDDEEDDFIETEPEKSDPDDDVEGDLQEQYRKLHGFENEFKKLCEESTEGFMFQLKYSIFMSKLRKFSFNYMEKWAYSGPQKLLEKIFSLSEEANKFHRGLTDSHSKNTTQGTSYSFEGNILEMPKKPKKVYRKNKVTGEKYPVNVTNIMAKGTFVTHHGGIYNSSVHHKTLYLSFFGWDKSSWACKYLKVGTIRVQGVTKCDGFKGMTSMLINRVGGVVQDHVEDSDVVNVEDCKLDEDIRNDGFSEYRSKLQSQYNNNSTKKKKKKKKKKNNNNNHNHNIHNNNHNNNNKKKKKRKKKKKNKNKNKHTMNNNTKLNRSSIIPPSHSSKSKKSNNNKNTKLNLPSNSFVDDRKSQLLTSKNDHYNQKLNQIRKKYKHDESLRSFHGHVNKEDRPYINTSDPVLFLEKALPANVFKELWLDLEELLSLDPTMHSSERFSRIPLLGGLHLRKNPPRSLFEDPITKLYLTSNPYHKLNIAFDFPPYETQKTRTILIKCRNGDVKTLVYRRYTYQKCLFFEVHTYEIGERDEKGTWISQSEGFHGVHFHCSRACKSRDDVTVRYQKVDPVRSNPIMMCEAILRSRQGGVTVRRGVSQVLKNTVLKGPVDSNLSSRPIHSRKYNEKKGEIDYMWYLLKEKKNPSDGIRHIQDINLNHPKGGIMIFYSLPSISILWNSLSRFYPQGCKVAFFDTKHKFANGFLTFLLLAFDLFRERPYYASAGYLYHQHADTLSYEYYFETLLGISGSDNLPEVVLKDDCPRISAALKKLVTELQNQRKILTLLILLCFWHINRNIELKCTSLSMSEANKAMVKKKNYELLFVKELDRFDSNINIYKRFLVHELKSEALWKYVLKNKIDKIRNRIHQVSQSNLDLQKIDLPKYNHPIESENAWIDGNISSNSVCREWSERLKERDLEKERNLLHFLLGLERHNDEFRKLTLREDVKKALDEIRSDLCDTFFSEYFRMTEKKDQEMLVIRFSNEFPGILSKYTNFPEIPRDKFVWNKDQSSWKIRDIPCYNISTIASECGLSFGNEKELLSLILSYLNTRGSFTINDKTHMTFRSKRLRSWANLTMRKDVLHCEEHKDGEVCEHAILFTCLTQQLDVLKSYRHRAPSLNKLFPEMSKRYGLKPSEVKKKSKKNPRKLVREIPIFNKKIKNFVKNGIHLFYSPKHQSQVILSEENLSAYNTTKEIRSFLKSSGIRGYSKYTKNDELKKYMYEQLLLKAKDNCVFCSEGNLGHVCDNYKCTILGIISEIKGNSLDLESLENMYGVISHCLGEECFLNAHTSSSNVDRSDVMRIVRNISKDGHVIDINQNEKLIFKLLNKFDKIRAIQFEDTFVNSRLVETKFVLTKTTICSDGSCFFDTISDQLSQRYNLKITHQEVRGRTHSQAVKSVDMILANGKPLWENKFGPDGGREMYLEEAEKIAHPTTYATSVAIDACSNEFNILIKILNSDAIFKTIWTDVSPLFPKEDEPLKYVTCVYYKSREHYEGLFENDFNQKTFQLTNTNGMETERRELERENGSDEESTENEELEGENGSDEESTENEELENKNGIGGSTEKEDQSQSRKRIKPGFLMMSPKLKKICRRKRVRKEVHVLNASSSSRDMIDIQFSMGNLKCSKCDAKVNNGDRLVKCPKAGCINVVHMDPCNDGYSGCKDGGHSN